MQIEKIKVSEIIPYEDNAKLHPERQVQQIKASINEFGFNDPIAIDENNVVIEGNGRLMAIKELGYEEVDCIRIEGLTEDQKRAYILVHNQLTMNTGFDIEILNKELEKIKDIDMTQFDFEIDIDFDLDIDLGGTVEEDNVPEPDENAEPKAKLGDIYKLGNHRLMCGDSTSLEDVAKLMGEEKADMLLTDPPYNVDYEGKTEDKLTIKNDKMSDGNFRDFLVNAFKAADSVMKPGAVFYIWHAELEGYNFRGACIDAGWKVRQCIIWNKNSMVLGRQDYQWKHEPCLYGWKDGASHLWASDRKQTTVIDFNRPTKADIHPTMKPVGLFDYQIKNNTKQGDIVLDLFNGSGTTIMACEQNKRVARCMELGPRYVDAAIKRWEDFTGQKAELIEG